MQYTDSEKGKVSLQFYEQLKKEHSTYLASIGIDELESAKVLLTFSSEDKVSVELTGKNGKKKDVPLSDIKKYLHYIEFEIFFH